MTGFGLHAGPACDKRPLGPLAPVRAKRSGAEAALPESRGDGKPGAEESPDRRFVCVFCGRVIASPRDILEMNGSIVHEFFNPEGALFRICCFSRAEGCFVSGEPTRAHTWFGGYSWRYAHCGGCAVQLGWRYDSGAGGFFGLILKYLAEGL